MSFSMINTEAKNKDHCICNIKEAAEKLLGGIKNLWITFKTPIYNVIAINISTMEAYRNNKFIALEKINLHSLLLIENALENKKSSIKFLTIDKLPKFEKPFSNPNKIYKIKELYEECYKIDSDSAIIINAILNPISNNETLINHLIVYKWFSGIDGGIAHSSIQITRTYIRLYLDGDGREEVIEVLTKLTEEYPYIFSEASYQRDYSNSFPCFATMTFTPIIIEKFSKLLDCSQINIQIY